MLIPDLIYETYLGCINAPRELLKSKIQYKHYLETLSQQTLEINKLPGQGMYVFGPGKHSIITPFTQPVQIELYRARCTSRSTFPFNALAEIAHVSIDLSPDLLPIFEQLEKSINQKVTLVHPDLNNKRL